MYEYLIKEDILRKNKIRMRNKKHQEIRDKAAKVLSLSTLVAVIMIFIFTIIKSIFSYIHNIVL